MTQSLPNDNATEPGTVAPDDPQWHNMKQLIARGPRTLPDQLQTLMHLCKRNKARSDEKARGLTLEESRYLAFANLADSLTAAQIRALWSDINQLRDIGLRTRLHAAFLHRLPADRLLSVATTLWDAQQHVKDPIHRAHILLALLAPIAQFASTLDTSEVLLDLLQQARGIVGQSARIRSLISLLPSLPHSLRSEVLTEVLDEIRQARNDSLRTHTLVTLAPYVSGDQLEAAVTIAARSQAHPAAARALAILCVHHRDEKLLEFALQRIETIQNEEDRAEALLALIPALNAYSDSAEPYPQALSRVLSTTISLTERRLRARIFVELAPYLTEDLQGEALSAVHATPDESERAMLIERLAPSLTPTMLVTALAVAHPIQEAEARARALVAIARQLSGPPQRRAIHDAHESVLQIDQRFEQVNAALRLMPLLTEQEQHALAERLLTVAREIPNRRAQARALALLAEHMPSSLHDAFEGFALALPDPEQRFNVLVALVPASDTERRERLFSQLYRSSRAMPLAYKQTRAWIQMAEMLPETHLATLLEESNKLADPSDRAQLMIAILSQLPEASRTPWQDKLLRTLAEIPDEMDRITWIVAAVPHLPPTERYTLLQQASKHLQHIHDEYDRATAIRLLGNLAQHTSFEHEPHAPSVSEVFRTLFQSTLQIAQPPQRLTLLANAMQQWQQHGRPDEAYAQWQHLLPYLATYPTADCLLALSILHPLLNQIDSNHANLVASLLGLR